MNEPQFEGWETVVRERAARFPYPPTPNIAGALRGRVAARQARSHYPRLVAIALLLLALLLAAPQVRAGLLSVFQVGAIRIFTEPAPPPIVTQTPQALFHGLAGESTLAEAMAQAQFPLRLPAYPGVGEPDRVFIQELEGQAVIFVWLDPEQPDRARLTLHQLSAAFWATKFAPDGRIVEAKVNGQRAVWLAGPHYLQVYDAQGRIEWAPRQLVAGNVLIWKEDDITYRLETILPLEEAIHLAESLR
jgi:hypothetical protein